MRAMGLVLALLLVAGGGGPPGEAPGAPGDIPRWTNGDKQGVGTSVGLVSKVWFTLGHGALEEVYYPTVDSPDLRRLELLVLDGSRLEEEVEATGHHVRLLQKDALIFEQTNTARTGRYRIRKVSITDPDRNAVLVHIHFEPLAQGSFRVFVLFDPALSNTGRGDRGEARDHALLTAKAKMAAALYAAPALRAENIGYRGTSDGISSLRSTGLLPAYTRARDGNVAGVAELNLDSDHEATLSLGFGADTEEALATARASLEHPFARVAEAYAEGWTRYLSPLRKGPAPFADAVLEAAMVLKAHEDKTYRGASVASLSIPWGDEAEAHAGVGGYHLVWSRDLYHIATALLALGDREGASRALDYLFTVQERPDGSFPQNTWLDGRPFWPSLQLDEVAFPLVLASLLGRDDRKTYQDHVKPAARLIERLGPRTPQERWEEQAGYSPSTIAAEIAGLLSAASIAEVNADPESAAHFRATADAWTKNLEGWCATSTGSLGTGAYILRIAQKGDPDSGRTLSLRNGAGSFDERGVVDTSFLELVRLGVKDPKDPLILRSLEVVDRTLRVPTPRGPGFYRYNHDGYGEKASGAGYDGEGVGRLWPLLTGERGEYEVAAGGDARPFLQALIAFGNEGGLLPEQVWDRPESPRPHLRFGEGTGSATPLAWSAAELVRLAFEIEDGRLLGTAPDIRPHFGTSRP